MIYLLNNLLEKPQLTVDESALFPEVINGLWFDLMNKEGYVIYAILKSSSYFFSKLIEYGVTQRHLFLLIFNSIIIDNPGLH